MIKTVAFTLLLRPWMWMATVFVIWFSPIHFTGGKIQGASLRTLAANQECSGTGLEQSLTAASARPSISWETLMVIGPPTSRWESRWVSHLARPILPAEYRYSVEEPDRRCKHSMNILATISASISGTSGT